MLNKLKLKHLKSQVNHSIGNMTKIPFFASFNQIKLKYCHEYLIKFRSVCLSRIQEDQNEKVQKQTTENQFCSTTDGRTNGKYYLTEFVSSSVKQYESLK